ncbi:hypothetical protein K439DRAFT_1629365 [Ramaria rubella]|nr:hypothetical protein K439DRAFT_1629365 [Ramaria rubella]
MLSALALLLYDHALCFDDEIDHIWSARQNVVTISFLLAQYIMPIFLILGILSVVSTIDSLHPLPSMVPY